MTRLEQALLWWGNAAVGALIPRRHFRLLNRANLILLNGDGGYDMSRPAPAHLEPDRQSESIQARSSADGEP